MSGCGLVCGGVALYVGCGLVYGGVALSVGLWPCLLGCGLVCWGVVLFVEIYVDVHPGVGWECSLICVDRCGC